MSNNTASPGGPERQCDRALQKANRVRTQRRLLRERIAHRAPLDGAKLAAKVLLHPPDYAQTMTVERLLTAIHGIGTVRAKAIAGPRSKSVLRALSTHDRVRFAVACQRHAAHLKHWQQSTTTNPKQSMRALDDANRVRLLRAQTLRVISNAPDAVTGTWRAAALINNPTRPAELDGLTVKAVLETIPGIEAATARKIMAPLTLSDSTRLEMLSRPRSAQLAAALISRRSRLQLPAATTDAAPARERRALPAAA
jgi:ribosomal protein S13